MIRTIASVIRGEGIASAARRARERVSESLEDARVRLTTSRAKVPLLNIAAGGLSARTGGVAVQLRARLHAERSMRRVAIAPQTWRELPSAPAVHIEGTAGVRLDAVIGLIDRGTRVVISVHDFSLWCVQPHFDPAAADAKHRKLAKELLERATALVFPSRFLFDQHRDLFALELPHAVVIEPAGPARRPAAPHAGSNVAFAGSVKRHKGAHFLPEIAEALGARGMALHVFGGGDESLLRAVRKHSNGIIHGYYTSAALPSLLARHRVGLVLLPSITPESFSLTMSEAWLAGASVAAFDLGAPAERIRRDGGGWVAPCESGAAGLIEIVDQWRAGSSAAVPRSLPSPGAAAHAHIELYRGLGLVP